MTIQEALQNIDIVVSNVQMKRQEHAALQDSVALVAGRCEVADKLEAAAKGAKVPEKSKKKEKKNGPTNKPTDISRTDQKDSKKSR